MKFAIPEIRAVSLCVQMGPDIMNGPWQDPASRWDLSCITTGGRDRSKNSPGHQNDGTSFNLLTLLIMKAENQETQKLQSIVILNKAVSLCVQMGTEIMNGP